MLKLLAKFFCLLAVIHFASFNAHESQKQILRESSKTFSSVAKTATPAVVSIRVKAKKSKEQKAQVEPNHPFQEEFFEHFFGPNKKKVPKKSKMRGSGCIISEDGYILTNHHVIKEAQSIHVLLNDGREFEAEVIGTDSGTDVAVIKIDAIHLPYLSFDNSDILEVGEWVIAIGNPLGLQASLTVGVVSARGRNNLHITDFGDLIQTDAAINPGNSGGPLLNIDGKVIGLNTAIVTTNGGYMGLGFAIPSNIAQHIMKQLIEKGGVSKGYLGIAPQDINNELAKSFELKQREGVLVADVLEQSPAEKAGIKMGDIIRKVNGKEVNNSVALSKEVGLMSPGLSPLLEISRKGQIFEVKVTLGVHPNSRFHLSTQAEKLGISVEAIDEEKIKQYALAENEKGVIVSSVAEYSPAQEAGIEIGDLVLAIDRKEIANLADYYDIINEASKDQRILLLIKHQGVMRFIPIELP